MERGGLARPRDAGRRAAIGRCRSGGGRANRREPGFHRLRPRPALPALCRRGDPCRPRRPDQGLLGRGRSLRPRRILRSAERSGRPHRGRAPPPRPGALLSPVRQGRRGLHRNPEGRLRADLHAPAAHAEPEPARGSRRRGAAAAASGKPGLPYAAAGVDRARGRAARPRDRAAAAAWFLLGTRPSPRGAAALSPASRGSSSCPSPTSAKARSPRSTRPPSPTNSSPRSATSRKSRFLASRPRARCRPTRTPRRSTSDLSVSYLVEGSVRSLGDRIRVSGAADQQPQRRGAVVPDLREPDRSRTICSRCRRRPPARSRRPSPSPTASSSRPRRRARRRLRRGTSRPISARSATTPIAPTSRPENYAGCKACLEQRGRRFSRICDRLGPARPHVYRRDPHRIRQRRGRRRRSGRSPRRAPRCGSTPTTCAPSRRWPPRCSSTTSCDEAFKVSDRALALNPNDSELLGQLGQLIGMAGRTGRRPGAGRAGARPQPRPYRILPRASCRSSPTCRAISTPPCARSNRPTCGACRSITGSPPSPTPRRG